MNKEKFNELISIVQKGNWSEIDQNSFDESIIEEILPLLYRYNERKVIESSFYFENYLWPNFHENSSQRHVISIILVILEKILHNRSFDDHVLASTEQFPIFFQRFLKLLMDEKKNVNMMCFYLDFLSLLFQHVDCESIRNEVFDLCHIDILSHSPTITQEDYFSSHSPAFMNLFQTRMKSNPTYKRDLFPFLVQLLLRKDTPDEIRVSVIRLFMTSLQHGSTRKFVKIYFTSIHLVPLLRKMNELVGIPTSSFSILLEFFSYYLDFPINDETCEVLDEEDINNKNSKSIEKLRHIGYTHFNGKLIHSIAMKNQKELFRSGYLKKAFLGRLDLKDLEQFFSLFKIPEPQSSWMYEQNEKKICMVDILGHYFREASTFPEIDLLQRYSLFMTEKDFNNYNLYQRLSNVMMMNNDNSNNNKSIPQYFQFPLTLSPFRFLGWKDYLLTQYIQLRSSLTCEIRDWISFLLTFCKPQRRELIEDDDDDDDGNKEDNEEDEDNDQNMKRKKKKTKRSRVVYFGRESSFLVPIRRFEISEIPKKKNRIYENSCPYDEVKAQLKLYYPSDLSDPIRVSWEQGLRRGDVVFFVRLSEQAKSVEIIRSGEMLMMINDDGDLDMTQQKKGKKKKQKRRSRGDVSQFGEASLQYETILEVGMDPNQFWEDTGTDKNEYEGFDFFVRLKPWILERIKILKSLRIELGEDNTIDAMNDSNWIEEMILGFSTSYEDDDDDDDEEEEDDDDDNEVRSETKEISFFIPKVWVRNETEFPNSEIDPNDTFLKFSFPPKKEEDIEEEGEEEEEEEENVSSAKHRLNLKSMKITSTSDHMISGYYYYHHHHESVSTDSSTFEAHEVIPVMKRIFSSKRNMSIIEIPSGDVCSKLLHTIRLSSEPGHRILYLSSNPVRLKSVFSEYVNSQHKNPHVLLLSTAESIENEDVTNADDEEIIPPPPILAPPSDNIDDIMDDEDSNQSSRREDIDMNMNTITTTTAAATTTTTTTTTTSTSLLTNWSIPSVLEKVVEYRASLLEHVVELAKVTRERNPVVGRSCETSMLYANAVLFPLLETLQSESEKRKSDMNDEDEDEGTETETETTPFDSLFENSSLVFFYSRRREKNRFGVIKSLFSEIQKLRPFELPQSNESRSRFLFEKYVSIVFTDPKSEEFVRICESGKASSDETQRLKFDTVFWDSCESVPEIEISLTLSKVLDLNVMKKVVFSTCSSSGRFDSPYFSIPQGFSITLPLPKRLIRNGFPSLRLGMDRPRREGHKEEEEEEEEEGDVLMSENNNSKKVNGGYFGLAHPVQFVDVGRKKYRGSSTCSVTPFGSFHVNLGEAEYIVSAFQYLRLHGVKAESVRIITDRQPQKELIEEILRRRCLLYPMFGLPNEILCLEDSNLMERIANEEEEEEVDDDDVDDDVDVVLVSSVQGGHGWLGIWQNIGLWKKCVLYMTNSSTGKKKKRKKKEGIVLFFGDLELSKGYSDVRSLIYDDLKFGNLQPFIDEEEEEGKLRILVTKTNDDDDEEEEVRIDGVEDMGNRVFQWTKEKLEKHRVIQDNFVEGLKEKIF